MVLQRVGAERANPEQNGYRTNTVEVISDSDNDSTDLVEVEELCNARRELVGNSTQTQEDLSKSRVKFLPVIEISSDSDDSEVEVISQTPMRPRVVSSRTPRSTKRYYRTRIIESSEEYSEPEIIDLSDSSDDASIPAPTKSSVQPSMPPGSENESVLDDSIIIFDEPRSARKPLRVALGSTTEELPGVSHPKASPLADLNVNHSVPLTPVKKKVAPVLRKQFASEVPDTPRSRSKKAQKEAEQKRLHDYAQQLFNDLNLSVFKQGLPVETKLNWNKRLLTTAGRAKFHRSRDGVQTTEIELAEKILDCEERIRNTLSHEMCHLATWVIDKKVDEHHGKLFKSWASKVMLKRPDVHVSVKHNYEIAHPFQWKCAKCAKIYGRFSKSIKPDECVCGACKEGELVPLFPVRSGTATKNAEKLSRLAASKSQESPRATKNNRDVDTLADIMSSTNLI